MKMSRSVSSVEVVSRLEMRALGRKPRIQGSGFRVSVEGCTGVIPFCGSPCRSGLPRPSQDSI
jgi:hypothetical protein